VPRSSGSLPNTLRTLYGALTARALVVIESDGPPLQPSLACLCTAETPPPLTIMPLLLERQPAGGTPRCATRARARTVATVGQSAQRSADRSVRRLIPRRRRTAPASRWAARPRPSPRRLGKALEQLLRLASPHRLPGGTHGRHRRRYALPVPLLSVTPNPLQGLCGSLTRLHGGGCAPPSTGSLRSFLPPCKRLYCNAAGLLRQGLASLHAPTGRPLPSDHQRRCMVCEAGRGAGGPRSPALCVAGDSRRLRVPDAARAWAGGQRGGSVPPHPSPVAALPG